MSGWVPLKTSSVAYLETLGPDAAWSGNNIVLTDAVLGDADAAPVRFVFAEDGVQLRLTLISYSVASPGAGNPYWATRFALLYSGDTLQAEVVNLEPPYDPDGGTWGAGDVTAFDPPGPFVLTDDFGNDFSIQGQGNNTTEPVNLEVFIEVWEGAVPCFWTDTAGVTEECA